MTVSLDITVQDNADYLRAFRLADYVTKAPIDLTGSTVAMQVRRAARVPGAPLLSAVCTLDSHPTTGTWTETILKADLAAARAVVAGAMGVARLAYDVVVTDPGGASSVARRGSFIIEPGVTA